MTDVTYENLPVSVQRREDQGMYVFGVTMSGAFVPFASRKLGGIDDDLQRAKDEAAELAAQAEQQPAPTAPVAPPVEP